MFGRKSVKITVKNKSTSREVTIYNKSFEKNKFERNNRSLKDVDVDETITIPIVDRDTGRTIFADRSQLELIAEVGESWTNINNQSISCDNKKTYSLGTFTIKQEASFFAARIYLDPLAQSFFIDKPSGVFVTALDLFFNSKDALLS